MSRITFYRPLLTLLFWSVSVLALTGCVERKITIGSDPPGALVYVNDVEMGRTPVTFPFTWYGDYDVRLRLDRYEGPPEDQKLVQYYLHTHKAAEAPVYQWLGIDLFAEVLPFEFKDEKVWAFAIPAVVQPNDADLLSRAKDLKTQLDTPSALEKPKNAQTQPQTQPKP